MRFFTICKFIIILLFFYAPSTFALTYHPDYASARAAAGCQTGLINQGDCWRGIKCGYKPVEHVYPRCDHAESCKDEFLSKLGFDPCDETPCVWMLDLDTTGPGSATASKSSADCAETITITVVPDNEFVTWELTTCSAHCTVSGPNEVEVTSNTAGDIVDVDITFTESEPQYAQIKVVVDGPGYVSGSACDDAIQCPGGNCDGKSEANMPCSSSLSAHPNMAGIEVEYDLPSQCSGGAGGIVCAVDPGDSVTVRVFFGDICTIDDDGDGIPNRIDLTPEEEISSMFDKTIAFLYGFYSGASESGLTVIRSIIDVFTGAQDAANFDVNSAFYDPSLTGSTYFVFQDLATGETFGVGNEELKDKPETLVDSCDPRFEYCGAMSNVDLSNYIPCESEYILDKLYDAEILEPSDVPDVDEGIPDGIYETPDSSCSCFDTVNKNTAATVDQLKNIAEINHSIAKNTEKTVEQLNTTNKLLERIAKKDFSTNFEDKDDFDDDDVSNIIDALNDDAENVDSGSVEPIENNDENKALVSYDDTSNDQLETLIETEKTGYKEDITQYKNSISSFISGKFQVSVSNPTCSFSAPIFGSQSILFNGCNYADTLSLMGVYIKFISYISAIVIILRA